MKTSSEIQEALARDLTEAFFKLLRQYPEKKADDVLKMVCLQKAPRFYVSYETARRHLSNLKKGTPISEKNENKKLLYIELYERWKTINGGNNYEKNSYLCLYDILNSQAPRFYIDFTTARRIIYKHLRKK